MNTTDINRLFIHDCRVELSIGLYNHEQIRRQPVLINIECETTATRRYNDIADQDVSHVVDYEPFYNFIHDELPRLGHIYLLESAAEAIAAFCLRDARVQKARIRIEKTTVFANAAGAGIEIIRTRS